MTYSHSKEIHETQVDTHNIKKGIPLYFNKVNRIMLLKKYTWIPDFNNSGHLILKKGRCGTLENLISEFKLSGWKLDQEYLENISSQFNNEVNVINLTTMIVQNRGIKAVPRPKILADYIINLQLQYNKAKDGESGNCVEYALNDAGTCFNFEPVLYEKKQTYLDQKKSNETFGEWNKRAIDYLDGKQMWKEGAQGYLEGRKGFVGFKDCDAHFEKEENNDNFAIFKTRIIFRDNYKNPRLQIRHGSRIIWIDSGNRIYVVNKYCNFPYLSISKMFTWDNHKDRKRETVDANRYNVSFYNRIKFQE